MGCESYSVAWISFAARSSDPSNFTLEEEDRTLGGSSKPTLGIFSLLCSNKPSVHLFRCVQRHHQLPENSMRRQLGLFDVNFWFGQVMSTVAEDLPFYLGILSLPVGRKLTTVILLFTLHLLH